MAKRVAGTDRREELAYLKRSVQRLHELALSNPAKIGAQLLHIADELPEEAAALEAELIEAGSIPTQQRHGAQSSRNAAGGWGEIRTHGGLAPTPVFKTGALNRSATHPATRLIKPSRRIGYKQRAPGNLRRCPVPGTGCSRRCRHRSIGVGKTVRSVAFYDAGTGSMSRARQTSR